MCQTVLMGEQTLLLEEKPRKVVGWDGESSLVGKHFAVPKFRIPKKGTMTSSRSSVVEEAHASMHDQIVLLPSRF